MQPSIPFVDLKAQYKAIKDDVHRRIQAVLDHGGFVNGPEVAELETRLAKFTGAKHALTCASGTDALLIPLMAMGIKPGDEIITTAFSFIATAEVIVLAGATPVYVDIDPETFNIDPKKVAAAITPKTKAIIPVSLYGQMADMDELQALAQKHSLFVMEDAAQSFGARYKTVRSCNHSLVSGTSFFPAKPLGCYGDGGAIFTNDEKLHGAMKEIREHGSEKRYYHTRLGINGRLDTLQCAILLAKLDRYEWEITQRQKVAARYNEAFAPHQAKGLRTPIVRSDRDSVWAQYTIRVRERDLFQKKLTELGVPTSIHYPRIMPDQPWYKEHLAGASGDWAISREAAQSVISLPMYPDMDTTTQDRIIDAVNKAMS